MLAADGGAAVAAVAVPCSASADIACEHNSLVRGADRLANDSIAPVDLVFVDPNVSDLSQLTHGVMQHAEVVLLDAESHAIEQISRALVTRSNVRSLHIVSHGASGTIKFASGDVDANNISQFENQLQGWRNALGDGADILLYACEAADGASGRQLVQRVADLTGADVAASIDATGARSQGGDWQLEWNVGNVESRLAFSQQAMDQYQHTLVVNVRARGDEGGEQFRLLIDGNSVGTYTTSTDWQTFSHNANGISPDDIRVEFFGDQYDPANGIDRNLYVDYISVDGTTYQTEDPSTYSTGTWLPSDGVTPGFRQSEQLSTDGYFQYAGGQQAGSDIEIRVRGDEGTEQFNLIVNDIVVSNYSATTSFQTISYSANNTVTADDIRIEFLNDQYDPANGIDANLVVDRITIDGTTYQTEAANVYSTGTWLPADGVTPGFRQSDTLHTNGYFQYASGNTGDPGTIALTLGSVQVNEDLGDLVITVLRQGGSDGNVSVDYQTTSGSATAGDDFVAQSGTLDFADQVAGRQIVIPIVEDADVESTETFTFTLSNPTGGALLGSATQTISILDNDEFSGVAFADDFETDAGWITNPSGTDTATTGAWSVGNPQGTSSGVAMQLNDTTSGQRALVTDPAAGASVGSFDVDGGLTSAVSPTISLPSQTALDLAFNYYFAHLDNGSSQDIFRVTILGENSSQVLLQQQGNGQVRAAEWTAFTADVSSFAGQDVRILVEAADNGSGSLVEAAVDDFAIQTPVIAPGVIGMATSAITMDEADSQVTINVQRTDGSSGTVTVAYTTADGTAVAGQDYTAQSGVLTLNDGETIASITVPIIDDGSDEDLEEFSVVLSNPTGGAVLSSTLETTVTIVDDDSTATGFLPDLISVGQTLNENRYIDTSTQSGRVLLRLSSEVANVGSGPLELWGGATSGTTQEVFQRIYGANNSSNDVLAGEFVFHPSHGHIHFEGFATYNLREINPDGSMGAVVASGGKTSFCVINLRNPFPDAAADADLVNGRGGNSCGSIQGLSVGSSDVYSSGLADQWIDVTDVESGNYFLEVIADPDNAIIEEDESNNSAAVQITLNNPQNP